MLYNDEVTFLQVCEQVKVPCFTFFIICAISNLVFYKKWIFIYLVKPYHHSIKPYDSIFRVAFVLDGFVS